MKPIDFNTFENLRRQGISDTTIADQMASYNKSFASQYEKIRQSTGNDPRAVSAYLNYRFYGDANKFTEMPVQKGFAARTIDSIWDKVRKESAQVGQAVEDFSLGKQGFGNTVAQVGGSIASTAAAPISKTFEQGVVTGAKALYDNPLTRATGVKGAIDDIGQTQAFQAGMQGLGSGINFVQQRAQTSPTLRSALSVGEAAFDVGDAVGLGLVGKAGVNALQSGARTAASIPMPFQSKAVQEVMELSDIGKEFVRQGADERLVTFIGGMSPENKMLAKEMTKRANEASKVLPGTAEKKALPIDIVGQQVKAPVEHLVKLKDEVGSRLGAMVQARADEVFDVNNSFNKLKESIEKSGIQINNGKVVDTGIFKSESRSILQKVVDFFGDTSVKTGKEIDVFRKKIFAEIKDAKKKGVLVGEDRLVNDIRMSLFEDMAQGDELMTWLNRSYAEISENVSRFMQKSGLGALEPGVDLDDMKFADLKLGEFSARKLGRASAQAETEIASIVETAKKFGFSGNTEFGDLIAYARNLDDMFDIKPIGSLDGALRQSKAGDVVGDMVRGASPSRTVMNSVADKPMQLLQKMRGISPEKRVELLLRMFDVDNETQLLVKVKQTMGSDVAKVVDDLVPEGVANQTVVDEFGKGKVINKTSGFDEAQNRFNKETLTPEERATGLVGGGGDNMPRNIRKIETLGKDAPTFDFKTKSAKRLQSEKERYMEFMKGKQYPRYGGGVDEILDVKIGDSGSLEFTYKNLETGEVRTHGTMIKPSEIIKSPTSQPISNNP